MPVTAASTLPAALRFGFPRVRPRAAVTGVAEARASLLSVRALQSRKTSERLLHALLVNSVNNELI